MTKNHLYDPLRGKHVRALPEERVRRQFVDWLRHAAGVPERLIAVEFPLSQLDPRSRKRADVVVWYPLGSGRGGLSPWLLAECKAPGVRLGDDVVDQVRGYAVKIRAEHVLLTNGGDTRIFQLATSRYVEIEALPRYPRTDL